MDGNVNVVENTQTTNTITIFNLLKKNILLIIIITLLCGAFSAVYSAVKVKPVYTATRSVMLRTSVKVDEITPTVQGSVTLAKMYLHQVEKTMHSPNIISRANEIYNKEGDKLSSNSVSVSYGTDSLIFKISYKASSEQQAKEKLTALITAVSERLHDIIEADNVALINVQKEATTSVSSSFRRNIVLGVAIGVILSIGIVLLMHTLDNTIKNKSEFEYITGVSVIALIDKNEEQ